MVNLEKLFRKFHFHIFLYRVLIYNIRGKLFCKERKDYTMANIIAVVWDFDKTLIKEYMQTPIFQDNGIDGNEFWSEVDQLPEKYFREQNVRVNPENIYLNHMINYAKSRRFKGLTNKKLREYGKELKFYEGVPQIFRDAKNVVLENPAYREYSIEVEHYIVSTGQTEIIRGSQVADYVEDIWGCQFIEGDDGEGGRCISEIGYTVDNTSKTRALFEINKGTNKRDDIKVNTSIPKEARRVRFENMIYIADGPSDVPAFSVVNSYGGSTFAVYPHGDMKALKQVEQMREDGRIQMYAEADYSQSTTANLWICNKIRELADRIVIEEREKIRKNYGGKPPVHLK